MKNCLIIIILTLIIVLGIPPLAQAGPEVRCASYGNADGLVVCAHLIRTNGGMVQPGMDANTARFLNNVNAAYPAGGYGYGAYYPQPNYSAAVANVASRMMYATAWTYNWKHGYVIAPGIWGMGYLMNYPW